MNHQDEGDWRCRVYAKDPDAKDKKRKKKKKEEEEPFAETVCGLVIYGE